MVPDKKVLKPLITGEDPALVGFQDFWLFWILNAGLINGTAVVYSNW